MLNTVELRLNGRIDHLRLAWQAGEALLEGVAFEEDAESTRYNILLAIQEMLTNVLRHGYDGDVSKPIELEIGCDDERVEIELRDQGPEFDPSQAETAVIAADKMPTEAGGFGIYIAQLVMDDVTYRREAGWNILTLNKRIRVESHQQA